MTQTMQAYQSQIEAYLKQLFSEDLPQARLLEAMNYSLLSGGKRVRPVMTLAFGAACGKPPEAALPFACAVELVHTYSLIHDDLPCMDDDDYRRGRPTCHKAYGEAGAVLAGDGLLTHAFSLIARADAEASLRVAMINELSQAAGPYGMVGGQQLDLDGEGRRLGVSDLETLQNLKTGAMIRCACRMGVLAAYGTKAQLEAADAYAAAVGLAFQIRDDMLDRMGDEALLGKPVGSDKKLMKSTFANLCSLTECQARIDSLTAEAVNALECGGFRDIDFLRALALQLANRNQ